MGSKKKNLSVVHDYYFPNYEDPIFRDRLVRANEYLISLEENPIEGLKYVAHKNNNKRKNPKFYNIHVVRTPEITKALSSYTKSAAKTSSARRSRFLNLLAIVISIFALLISQHALDWLPSMLRFGGYPYIGVLIFALLGWFVDKNISVPDEKYSETLAVVMAVRESREAERTSKKLERPKSLWCFFNRDLHR